MSLTNFKMKSLKDKLNEQALEAAKKQSQETEKKEVKVANKKNK